MSTYFTVCGQLKYKSPEALNEAKKFLVGIQQMNEDGFFLDELNNPISDKSDIDGLFLDIPQFHYRNLARYVDEMFKGATGKIVWTSTDGMFDGGVIVDGAEICYDLRKWALDNGEFETDIPDFDKEFDEYCEWMAEVEQDFFEQNGF